MESLFSILPVTVLVAIGIFVLKELFEGVRRYRGDIRKKKALRTLLARECELNHWTIKSIRHIVETIRDESENGAQFEFIFPKNGNVLFRVKHSDSDSKSGSALAGTHRAVMDKNLLEVATLDNKLYSVLQTAYDATAQLEHVRQSLIYFVDPEDEQDKMHLDGFVHYALDELQDVFTKIECLYKECTDKGLETYRLR
ncbi:hypothetical protein D3870_18305 [Noviherbaspirillum cavernae]|uniref:Uncharacterized protein n=1 Tax=Noviherbaspirillum cavernae TaxID=2320862 RepID=A0A418X5M5_9BURK|nr:hypothetical protein [Noviherbaspirillum cavernae]RJG07686.1 hypothetical protein D3870_18305 [Noviherbaspirillum cavernae]